MADDSLPGQDLDTGPYWGNPKKPQTTGPLVPYRNSETDWPSVKRGMQYGGSKGFIGGVVGTPGSMEHMLRFIAPYANPFVHPPARLQDLLKQLNETSEQTWLPQPEKVESWLPWDIPKDVSDNYRRTMEMVGATVPPTSVLGLAAKGAGLAGVERLSDAAMRGITGVPSATARGMMKEAAGWASPTMDDLSDIIRESVANKVGSAIDPMIQPLNPLGRKQPLPQPKLDPTKVQGSENIPSFMVARAAPSFDERPGRSNLSQEGFDPAWNAASVSPSTVMKEKEGRGDLQVSTRVPTSVGGQDPNLNQLNVDVASMAPNHKAAAAKAISQYENMRPMPGASDDEIINAFKEGSKDNLQAVWDMTPPDVRDRAMNWYDGVHSWSGQLAAEHEMPHQGTAGMAAALSPQKDWYENATLTERIANTMRDNQTTPWSPEMDAVADKIWTQKPIYQQPLEEMRGKTLGEMPNDYMRGMWVRTYDQAHNPQEYRVMNPEGDFGDLRRNNDGTPATLRWQTPNAVAKAVSIYRDPSLMNISNSLGDEHKVRSFYNNIIDPDNPAHVTIDTHAVGAANFRPVAATQQQAAQNFGGRVTGTVGAGESSISGTNGTYPIYADAYREGAKDNGVLPRQYQSVDWEGIRSMFEGPQKNALMPKAAQIWQRYRNGEIDAPQARNEVAALANPINPPWYRPGGGDAAPSFTTSYERQLPAADEPGQQAANAGATGASAGSPSVRRPFGTANIAGPSGGGSSDLIGYNNDLLTDAQRDAEENARRQVLKDPDGIVKQYHQKFGNTISADNARELFPSYNANRALHSASVQAPADWVARQAYAEDLAKAPEGEQTNTVLFTAGGAGAGKSSGLKNAQTLANRSQIIYDTNLNRLSPALDHIDDALSAGKDAHIIYTYRDPLDSFNGVLDRTARQEEKDGVPGRTVPIDAVADTHVGANETMPILQWRYQGDPRVQFHWFDNSRGEGNGTFVNSFEDLPPFPYSRDQLTAMYKDRADEALASGRISPDAYSGIIGPPQVKPPGTARSTAGLQGQPQQGGGGPSAVGPATSETARLASMLASQKTRPIEEAAGVALPYGLADDAVAAAATGASGGGSDQPGMPAAALSTAVAPSPDPTSATAALQSPQGQGMPGSAARMATVNPHAPLDALMGDIEHGAQEEGRDPNEDLDWLMEHGEDFGKDRAQDALDYEAQMQAQQEQDERQGVQ